MKILDRVEILLRELRRTNFMKLAFLFGVSAFEVKLVGIQQETHLFR